MNRPLKSALAAALAVAVGSSAALADKWNMPVRSNERNYFTRNILQFAEEVKAGTAGKLEIVIHPEDSLTKQPEVKRAVQTGQVQLGELLMSIHSNENAVFGVDAVPFLATNAEENRKLLAAARPFIEERLKKQGIRLLFVVPWPPNSFYAGKEIKSVADYKGVRFRAFNPVTGRLAELMGAIPVTVQQSEVPQAFSTGVIQAMITSPATGVDTQAWDFVKYYYDVKAMAPWNIVIANERVFSRLDPKTQEAVMAAAKVAEERGWKLQAEETGKLVDTLRSKGMDVREGSPELMGELRKIGDQLIQEWSKAAGEDGQKILDAYRKG
ncbi:TRAP transporter substrate-binding protein [Enterovirga sp.]|jgi:TRAP-type C4-dicarboxylate transport system substrate-binding protein|uniref:TRAP transporter substrate-binding protein n=1 Tax=Enterovirga sp. TaxID=2026350 RepID=UPI0026217B70|nr:TRAP transporter substrate-binding protein [Enterovirga sp.]MDB5591922.1 C4-dicarboxylate transporter substrate-binding protein [Enterovirga sp.]